MKIIQLRFKNLNSLVGEWSIDFTSPEYIEDGIFAISGPTGAGKSTILDAICLALYGCTPRLENISKSSNELMSRQTGECFAEVVFETNEGRFRAHWSQHRARGKANGELQPPRHEISEEISGKILASQLKTTEAEIVSKTGMDFKRFTQSMMLAQGGFAAFLQATADERAPILEQITGTEIYSSISRHVFERQKEEKRKLETLEAEKAGISFLSPEEEEQVIKTLEEKNREKLALAAMVEQVNDAIKWLISIHDLKQELQQISVEQADLDRESLEFEPKKGILKRALKALPLDAGFSALAVMRDQQKRDMQTLSGLQLHVPELKKALEAAQDIFRITEKEHDVAVKEREKLLKLTTSVRLLDQDITQKEDALKFAESQISKLNREKAMEETRKSDALSSISELDLELQDIGAYQDGHQPDATLISELSGIKASVQGLSGTQKILTAAIKDLSSYEQSLKEKNREIDKVANELAQVKETNITDLQNITAAQSSMSKLLNGRTIEETTRKKDELLLQLAELKKITDLEGERARLEDGKACPLCGSLHHPYAEGNIPQATELETEYANLIQLIREYEKAGIILSQLLKKEALSASVLIKKQQQYELALQFKSGIEGNIARGKEVVESARINFDKAAKNVKKLLAPFGIPDIPEKETEVTALTNALETRKDEWQKKSERKTEISQLIHTKQADIAASDKMISSKAKDIVAKEKESNDLKTSLNAIKLDRVNLFGEKAVDREEQISLDSLKEKQMAKDKASDSLLSKQQQFDTNTNRINDLIGETQARQSDLETGEALFREQVLANGFSDEEAYHACKLSDSERKLLEETDNRLQTRHTQLTTRKEENEKKLKLEESRKLTEEDTDTLKEKHELSKAGYTAVVKETGALEEKLKNSEENKVRGMNVGMRIERQTGEFRRWAALSSLIGSADGKKYRNFAQGLTLEIMVSFANIQLAKLSDRYLLTRDREDPLELKVIDNYQAGDIRSTKNLSGGESFIVSMALALGLSGMSSRNVRVDSLFLDEGFGSLDEDTLEAALSTLAGLRQDGKMIGVISHVGAMKERINTKIIVQPVREGRSTLSGPGICKL